MINEMMINATEVKPHNPVLERISEMESCIASYTIEMEIYDLEDYRVKENNKLIESCTTIKDEAISIHQEITGATYNTELRQAIATHSKAVHQLDCLDDEEMRIAGMLSIEENEELKTTYKALVEKLKHSLSKDFNHKA